MSPARWRATVRVVASSPQSARTLALSLSPEAAREVPRARSWVRRPTPGVVEVVIEARDTGALRAGLNSYLGWIQLVQATETSATYTAGRISGVRVPKPLSPTPGVRRRGTPG